MLNELRVSKTELIKALMPIKKHLRPLKRARAIMSFDGNKLHVRLPQASVVVDAVGHWEGEVQVAISFFKMLYLYPPKSDPLVFRIEQNRLFVDHISIDCVRNDL